MKFSLVIPCYNEAPNLQQLLDRCSHLGREPGVEVVLVDNGSTDASPDKLRKMLPSYKGLRSIRVEHNRGYGFGILSGLQAAEGNILGWTHADLQTDPLDVLKGLAFFDRHGDNLFVKGLRYGRPFGDLVFTAGMGVFETVLLGKRLWDINAQPTMFSRRFFLSWHSPPNDFSLDLYAYYWARKGGLPVHRFPVCFARRARGTSTWNVNWAAKRKFIRRTVEFSLELKKSLSS